MLTVAGLAGCAPALPDTVVPDSTITVGWAGGFTSTNAASAPTAGDVDVAEAIRADFGDVIDGEFVPDESFGSVRIVEEEPFTVRYDLAEPTWSDGIPLDAADLLLGWAGASGSLPAEVDATDEGDAAESADTAPEVPRIDEFARAIDVVSPTPLRDWQLAVRAPVPAHVVGQKAFGVDDPMEAKQAVIEAIREDDAAALEKIAQVWHTGFDIEDPADIPAELLLSSGPYLVQGVEGAEGEQKVELVPNPGYRGAVTPKVATIELVPQGDDAVAAVGTGLDVAQVAATTANRGPIRELERKDFTVDTSHDGTLWALMLNPTRVFAGQQARTAFLHATPANALVERGAGVWASAYTGTNALLAAPGSRAYDIVAEDSGFAQLLGESRGEPELEREAAGLASGTRVCVLYDRRSEFATGAFAGLREVAAEAGWNIVDCGSDDYAAALTQRGWDAVIARAAVPQTPDQIAAQWGSGGTASITGHADAERDSLIAQLAQTPDVYEARDVLAAIEATIVRSSLAVPLAVNPRVTIAARGVVVAPRSGVSAPLTYSVAQWEAAR